MSGYDDEAELDSAAGEAELGDDGYHAEGSLGEEIRRQLKAAPWYVLSLVGHMVVLILMMLIPTKIKPPDRDQVVITTEVIEEDPLEEEDEPEEEPEEDPLEAVMTETDSVTSPTEVVTETEITTDVTVDTEIEMEDVVEEIGDPTEDEVGDPSKDAAPSILGMRGAAFSNKAGMGTSPGFRGGFGKIGRGIKAMIGHNGRPSGKGNPARPRKRK